MVLPAVTVPDTLPLAGAVKLTWQTMEDPLTNGAVVGTVGVQVTVAEGGNPAMSQVAATAVLGPLLVQVKLPVTGLPAVAVLGKLTVEIMSADADTVVLYGAVLLLALGSFVALPAVTVPDTLPLAGAV